MALQGEMRGPVDKRVIELERAALRAKNASVALLKRVQKLTPRYKAQAAKRKQLSKRDEDLLDLLEGSQFHKTQLELSRDWRAYERDANPMRETYSECRESLAELRKQLRIIRDLISRIDTPQIRKGVRADIDVARTNLVKIETQWAGLSGIHV